MLRFIFPLEIFQPQILFASFVGTEENFDVCGEEEMLGGSKLLL
jgi:hypothetical protein